MSVCGAVMEVRKGCYLICDKPFGHKGTHKAPKAVYRPESVAEQMMTAYRVRRSLCSGEGTA